MPRMLIVDDELDICDVLQAFFTSKGFSVSSAFSGEEALDQLQDSPADIVLLDINLPGLSGLETLRVAKRRFPDVNVVMITSHDEKTLRDEAKFYGAKDYITKPFDFTDQTWSSVLE